MKTNPLTHDEALIMRTINRLGDEASWYNVGQTALGRMQSPGTFSTIFDVLVDKGMLAEHPRGKMEWYTLTEDGRVALSQSDGPVIPPSA